MRKSLLVAGLLASAALYAEGNKIEVRGGIDLGQRFSISDGGLLDKDAKFSYELAAEYRREMPYNFELGVGIAYQDHGKTKSKTSYGIEGQADLYDSIPLYVTARYNFKNSTELTPYLKTNIGYSFNVNDGEVTAKYNGIEAKSDVNAKDGFYYAVGGGLEYKNFIVDLSYQRNYSKVEGKNPQGLTVSDGNGDFDRVTLGFGYNFEF